MDRNEPPSLPKSDVQGLIPRSPEWFQTRLDPNSTLPKVVIDAQSTNAKGTFVPRNFIIKDSNGSSIGNFILNISTPPNAEATAYLNAIKLDENMKGRGFGRGTYLAILNYLGQTVKLTSGFQLSREAKPIWDWLVEKGVARKTKEGKIDETRPNAGYTTDEYEII